MINKILTYMFGDCEDKLMKLGIAAFFNGILFSLFNLIAINLSSFMFYTTTFISAFSLAIFIICFTGEMRLKTFLCEVARLSFYTMIFICSMGYWGNILLQLNKAGLPKENLIFLLLSAFFISLFFFYLTTIAVRILKAFKSALKKLRIKLFNITTESCGIMGAVERITVVFVAFGALFTAILGILKAAGEIFSFIL